MDGAHKSERKFPGHTTAELKASVAYNKAHDPALAVLIEAEIARRDAGLSKPFAVPQVGRVS